MSDFLDNIPSGQNDTPVIEVPKSDNSELDAILETYKNAPPSVPTPAQPEKLPFLSHDAGQAPKQEYYTRGAKKGQPKPPKKGTAPPLNPAGQLSIQATTFITGAVFITMVDLLIPLIITGIYNFMQSKKTGTAGPILDYEKVKMSASQRNDLAVVGDAVVRELKLSGSPTLLFLIGLAGVYFMNFILQKSLADKEHAKKQAENEKKNNTSVTQNTNR